MSLRAAVVENGMVVNVCEVDGPGEGWIVCPGEVNIGWSYDGSSFAPPPEPVPLVEEPT